MDTSRFDLDTWAEALSHIGFEPFHVPGPLRSVLERGDRATVEQFLRVDEVAPGHDSERNLPVDRLVDTANGSV